MMDFQQIQPPIADQTAKAPWLAARARMCGASRGLAAGRVVVASRVLLDSSDWTGVRTSDCQGGHDTRKPSLFLAEERKGGDPEVEMT